MPTDASLERLADVTVALRCDLDVVRQVGPRGNVEYVVHDPLRFTSSLFEVHEYLVLTAIDGRRTLGAAFEGLVADGVLHADARSSFFQFVLQQHHRGLLRLPLSDGQRVWERARRERRAARAVAPLRRLLYWRVPVWNPDPFLDRTLFAVRWLFGPVGLLLWGAVMLAAVWLGGSKFWPLLSGAGDMLSVDNLLPMWVTLVGLKAIHEFGHAYACRSFGGRVPEMGIAFVLGAPCAYVDAGASWAFPSVARRVWVAMAGMYVESFIAALALLVWVSSEDGAWQAVAQNIVVLATVVTVLFNINPLMRFDGYYVFSDLVGEPNLRPRADAELARIGRRLLGLPTGPAPDQARLLVTYGVGAFVYKIVLAFGIVRLVVFGWPVVGTLLGIGFAWMLLIQPVVRFVRWLWSSEECQPIRPRARALAVAMVTVVPAGVSLAVPASFEVVVPGTVVATRTDVLRAPFDGYVRELRVREGDGVTSGQLLVLVESLRLNQRALQLRAEWETARAEFEAARGIDPAAERAALQRLDLRRTRLRDLEQQLGLSHVQAPGDGVVTVLEVVPGQFVAEGAELATVVGHGRRVEAYVPARRLRQSRISAAESVRVQYSRGLGRHPGGQEASVISIGARASRTRVPELMTDVAGGGPIRAVAGPRGAPTTEQAYVRVVLEPLQPPSEPSVGRVVRVRFGGRIESVGTVLARSAWTAFQQWSLATAQS